MENTVHVRAQLTSCSIKNGVVLQFELESDSKDALPMIAMMTRHFVELDITDEQMALDIDEGPVDGQLEADFDEPEDELDLEADIDRSEAFRDPYELPEAIIIEEADDEDEA